MSELPRSIYVELVSAGLNLDLLGMSAIRTSYSVVALFCWLYSRCSFKSNSLEIKQIIRKRTPHLMVQTTRTMQESTVDNQTTGCLLLFVPFHTSPNLYSSQSRRLKYMFSNRILNITWKLLHLISLYNFMRYCGFRLF